jgi:hypothetical protein
MTKIPDALRTAIEQDLGPVRPLPPPGRRTLPLVPFAALLLVASVALFGRRLDAPALGVVLTWGASTLQAGVGLALIWAALREAVPATVLPRRLAWGLGATVLVVVLATTWVTWLASPTTIRPGAALMVWRICVTGPLLAALPAFAAAALLVARAFPIRPWLAGALYGLGVGLMSDAGWRLYCHFSDPVHVLGAHTFAVVLLTAAGTVTAIVTTRR